MVRRFVRMVLAAAAILCLTTTPARAQEMDARLRGIFERGFAKSAEQREWLQEKLREITREEVLYILTWLDNPEENESEAIDAHIAIHAIALVAGQPDSDDLRSETLDAFTHVLVDPRQSVANKRFVLGELPHLGSEEAVPLIEPFLTDPATADAAAQALVRLGDNAARAAVVRALDDPPPGVVLPLINAAGELATGEAVGSLSEYAQSKDPVVARCAVWALASIPDLAASRTLSSATNVREWYGHNEMMAALLRFTANLPQPLEQKNAMRVYRQIIRAKPGVEFAHLHAAALTGLVAVSGDEALRDVIGVMGNLAPSSRAVAVDLAVELDGNDTSEKLAEALERGSPRARTAIMEALVRRGDPGVLGAVLDMLDAEELEVQLTATRAVAALGKVQAIDHLVKRLGYPQPEIAHAVSTALIEMPGAEVDSALLAAFPDLPPPAQADLMHVLAVRSGAAHYEFIESHLEDEDPTLRRSAIAAMGYAADSSLLPQLVDWLTESENDAERAALEGAIGLIGWRARESGQDNIAGEIAAALPTDDVADRISLVHIAAKIGGPMAFQYVQAAARDARDDLRPSAIDALANWEDPSVASEVLAVASNVRDRRDHPAAVDAVLALLARQTDTDPIVLATLYRAAINVAHTDALKARILQEMARHVGAAAVEDLREALGNPALANAAGLGLVRVADDALPWGWELADEIVADVESSRHVSAGVRDEAARLERRIADAEGYVTDWRVAGPYREKPHPGRRQLWFSFPPEEGTAAAFAWKELPLTTEEARFWYVDLRAAIDAVHSVAYLRTRVYVPHTRKVLLEIGTDDGYRAYVNGKAVAEYPEMRPCVRGDDEVLVDLHEGWNDLLLKVFNEVGEWGAVVRILAADGTPLPGLKVDAAP